MRRNLLPLCLGPLLACGTAQGGGATLRGTRLLDLSIRLEGEPLGLCPGFGAQLRVEVTLADGRTLSTAGGETPLAWSNFDLELQGGAVTTAGRVLMQGDPRLTGRRPARLVVRSLFHASPTAVLEIPARYDCAFAMRFDGARGKVGQPGQDAPDLEVTLSPVELPGKRVLVRVVARQRGTERLGLVYLEVGTGGRIAISARGGAPGPQGSRGGAGARVELVVDPRVEGADSAVEIDNRGTDGGPDGPPVVTRVDEVLEAF